MFAGCILSQAVKKWSPESGGSDKGGETRETCKVNHCLSSGLMHREVFGG